MAEPQKAAAPAAPKAAAPKAAAPGTAVAVAKPAAAAAAPGKPAAPAAGAAPTAADPAKAVPKKSAAAPAPADTASAPTEAGDDLEAMKKRFKPKKKVALPSEMLSDAKSYDDKLILMKFLTEKEKGRVVLMVKNMLKGALDTGKKK